MTTDLKPVEARDKSHGATNGAFTYGFQWWFLLRKWNTVLGHEKYTFGLEIEGKGSSCS